MDLVICNLRVYVCHPRLQKAKVLTTVADPEHLPCILRQVQTLTVLRVLRSIKPKCRQMEGDITWV